MEVVGVLAFVVVLVLVLMAYSDRGGLSARKVANLSIPPDQPPQELLDDVTRALAREGYLPVLGAANIRAFSKRRRPDYGLALVLLLLGVIPGILYLVAASRDATVRVSVEEDEEGAFLAMDGDHQGTLREAAKITERLVPG